MTEDSRVSRILKVDPNISHSEPYMRGRREWQTTDARLVFQFQSARIIEVESENVELIPLTETNEV